MMAAYHKVLNECRMAKKEMCAFGMIPRCFHSKQ